MNGTMRDRPWFPWDVDVTEAQFRERLRHPDARIRAQRIGHMLRDWELIRRHLGRERAFWDWLFEGWREDGLLPAA